MTKWLRRNIANVTAPVFVAASYFTLNRLGLLEVPQEKALSHLETLLVTNVSVMGAFLGFIITTLTVLAGVLPLRIFKKLTKTGRTHELISHFMRLIYVTSLELPVSVVSIFFLKDHFKLVALGNIGIGYLWVFNFIECMTLFEAVLRKRFESAPAAT